jgi:hypothetical protein
VDTVVNFAGQPHTMAAVPVRTLVSGDRYAIIFPSRQYGGGALGMRVSTIHNPDTFVPNITIDSFPAQVQVTDGLDYDLSGDPVGGYSFLVSGDISVDVSIDLGDTIVSIGNSFQVYGGLNTSIDIGSSANAVPFAQYGKYVDQVSLIHALDVWIDYIRIVPLVPK